MKTRVTLVVEWEPSEAGKSEAQIESQGDLLYYIEKMVESDGKHDGLNISVSNAFACEVLSEV